MVLKRPYSLSEISLVIIMKSVLIFQDKDNQLFLIIFLFVLLFISVIFS